jgi:hypothetical protein
VGPVAGVQFIVKGEGGWIMPLKPWVAVCADGELSVTVMV